MGVGRVESDPLDEIGVEPLDLPLEAPGDHMFVSAVRKLCHWGNIA